MRLAGSGVLRGMMGEKQWDDMNPCSSPERLDSQGMRGDVDQDRADLDSGDQAPLHGRAHGHGQVGFDLRVHGPAQPLFQKLVDQRGAGCPSDQNNLVDLGGLQFERRSRLRRDSAES